MSASDRAFIFEMTGIEVQESAVLDAEPIGFLVRRGPGERDLILTRDAEPLAKNLTRLKTSGPKAAVMPLVLADKPLPEHGRR